MLRAALWKYDWVADARVAEPPPLKRVVISIDPSATHGPDADETGIAATGLGEDGDFYVLHSGGYRLSPDAWARTAVNLYDQWEADKIIGERNNGGDMVESTLKHVRKNLPIKTIHASRGKRVRAEPVAALYEQGRVHHVGIHKGLEDQLISFTGDDRDLDDELDAMVYGVSELANVRRGWTYGVSVV